MSLAIAIERLVPTLVDVPLLAQAGSSALSGAPLVPAWIGIPLAGIVMLLASAHVVMLQSVDVPPSRRRIRTASGLIILVLAPLLCYAMCIASTANARQFVLVWMAVLGLLFIVLMLAIMDMFNNVRIAREQMKQGLSLSARAAAEALARARDRRARPRLTGEAGDGRAGSEREP
ncbi:MAG: hypothetical protein ACK55O_03850 [Phycisphaerales bacterium]|nr:hypothetical protein [Phycisphaeraceae bacterium]